MTVLCYTLPILLQAGREVAAGLFGTACKAYLGVFTLLVVGSSAYSQQWPERWSPGSFDLLGNSHQVRVAACVGARKSPVCTCRRPGLQTTQVLSGMPGSTCMRGWREGLRCAGLWSVSALPGVPGMTVVCVLDVRCAHGQGLPSMLRHQPVASRTAESGGALLRLYQTLDCRCYASQEGTVLSMQSMCQAAGGLLWPASYCCSFWHSVWET